jgi:putative redox protein
MKIELSRQDDAYHMQAVNEDGCTVDTDGAEKIGGSNKGMRPMQLLLVGIGSCSSIDVISILKKMKQPLEDIKITVTAEREENKAPALFTDIHVHFRMYGEMDEEKAERAVHLSMEKYCSVTRILEKTANITWSYELNPS